MTEKNITALIFDMDGLIFDSERVVQRSWNRAGEVLGIPKMGEHIYHTIGFNVVRRETYFRTAIREDFPMERFNTLTRAFFKEIVAAEGLAMKPGVKELLAYAKENGYKLAVASSSRREHAVDLLTRAGVYPYFDGSVFGDMVKNAKPDPEIYRTACEVIGAEPKRAVALEDAPAGVRSASGAGMRAIMIPDLVQPDEETMKYVWKKYDTLLDVLELLKEQGNSCNAGVQGESEEEETR